MKFQIQYKKDLLSKLQRRLSGPIPTEVLEAERIVEDFQKKQDKARQDIQRIEESQIPNDACPHCFYVLDVVQVLKLVDSPSDNMDLFRCPSCTREFEEPI